MLCPCPGNQGPAEHWEDLREVSVFQEVCFAGEEAPGAGSKEQGEVERLLLG